MSFLSPWTAVLAAAIALPIFIALYILRLRRQRKTIGSTLLWRQATRDLEVNAPIRRLRLSLLFLIQLLLLAALIAALGEPALRGEGDMAQRIIILIDRSASMNATDASRGRTRLEHAKSIAAEIIENLAGRQEQSMAAVLAFGATADVITGLTRNTDTLLAGIQSIEPTDEEADFAAALDLAGSFAAARDESEAGAAEVVIISDGGVARQGDAAAARVTAGSVRFVQAGPAPGREGPNIGFVTASARRDPDDPATAILFARLLSTFDEPMDVAVTVRRGADVASTQTVSIPAAGDEYPGEASMTLPIEAPDGAFVTLAHDVSDALAADDSVSLVIPAPRQPRVLIVHGEEAVDPYVEQLFEAAQPESLRVMPVEQYEGIAPDWIDSGREFDLIVFDRVTGYELPGVPTMSFGSGPEGVTLRDGEEQQGQRILSWDRQHALLRHVSLDTLVFAGVEAMELPEGADVLARGRSGPVVAVMKSRGARHVLVGFALRRSNWPRELSIALFMQNALEHLWLGRSSDAGLVSRPGEPVTVRVMPATEEIVMDGPESGTIVLDPERPGLAVTLPTLRRAGVYTLEGAAPPHEVLAVAVLSDLESDVRVEPTVTVNARPAPAGPVVDVAPQPIWTWVLLAALVILTAEWFFFLALKRV